MRGADKSYFPAWFTVMTAAWMILPSGCAERAERDDIDLDVGIVSPLDGTIFTENDLVLLEANVAAAGTEDINLDRTVVVWTSDVVGVLEDVWGACAPWAPEEAWEEPDENEDTGDSAGDPPEQFGDLECWISYPEQIDDRMIWQLVAQLAPGTHMIHARAMDLEAGRAHSLSASVAVTVEAFEGPQVHVVATDAAEEFNAGEDFVLSTWVDDDREGDVGLTWSSSSIGIFHQQTLSSNEVLDLPCHAGGEADPDDPEDHQCYLSPGTHVLSVTGVDEQGAVGHGFITLRITGPEVL